VILPLELADSSIIRRVCSRPQANPARVQRLCLGRNAPSASRDKPNTVSGALRPKARVCEALRQFMGRECTLRWLQIQTKTHLDRAGSAHPTADQGFRLFARVDFTLIQCHSIMESLAPIIGPRMHPAQVYPSPQQKNATIIQNHSPKITALTKPCLPATPLPCSPALFNSAP
jgi:hypothetical protein